MEENVNIKRTRSIISDLQLMQQNIDKLENGKSIDERLPLLQDINRQLVDANDILLTQMFKIDKELKLVEDIIGSIWVLKQRINEEISRLQRAKNDDFSEELPF